LLSCRSVSADLRELPRLGHCPRLCPLRRANSAPVEHPPMGTRATPEHRGDISHTAHQRTGKLHHERPTQALKRRRRTPRKASTGSASDQRSTTRTGVDPDSRALLRLSSRSSSGTVRHPMRSMLSWPSPPPRPTSSTVGLSPSPLALPDPAPRPAPKDSTLRQIAAPQGLAQSNLGITPKSHPNLLEVSHLIRLFAYTELSSNPPASRRTRGGIHPKMDSLGSACHWL
jgi:hypothetical protein